MVSSSSASTLASGIFSGSVVSDKAPHITYGGWAYWDESFDDETLWLNSYQTEFAAGIRWGGSYGGVHDDRHWVSTENTSTLEVQQKSFHVVEPDLGNPILLGNIVWNNYSNHLHGGQWTGAFEFQLDFDDPETSGPLTQTFSFLLENTVDPSLSVSVNEQTGQNPDIISEITRVSPPLDFPIALGNGVTLSSINFGDADNSSGSIFENGQWVNPEGNEAALGVYGTFERLPDPTHVPLPAGIWLMFAALGGLCCLKHSTQTA